MSEAAGHGSGSGSGGVLGRWWLAIRPRTLWAACGPVLAGSALALWHGAFAPLWALVALGGALLIQVGCNLHNDWADARHGADNAARVGPTRVTQAGLIPPRQVLGGAAVMFAGAGALGVLGVLRGGWPLAAVLTACVAAAISYTGGPRPLGYLGLGELLVLVFFGPVAVGATYYLQALALPPLVLAVGVGPGLLAAAILVVNNLRDRATDELAGKRTLAVRFGDGFARAEYLTALLAGVLLPPALLLINVLRGGLTVKHVDKPELLRVAKFVPEPPNVLRPAPAANGERHYPTPAAEFALSSVALDELPPGTAFTATPAGPEILLLVHGHAVLRDAADRELSCRPGEAVFVPAAAGNYRAGGTALMFRARVPHQDAVA